MSGSETSIPDLPEGVRLGDAGGLPAVHVQTSLASATVVLQGAHLTAWQPAGQQPVIFTSERALFEPGVAIRGGIPLAGPWFGPGRGAPKKPAHGFYRIAPWRLTSASTGAERQVRLQLELTADDLSEVPAGRGWPDDARLTYEIEIGQTLRVALTTATGADGMDLEEALHSYFAVGDVRQVRVEGLAGATYVDKVADGARSTQDGEVTFAGETDRVYLSGATTAILDPVLGRRIEISPSGANSTVVWNPWQHKAAEMKDFAPDEWTGMLCVETANVLDDAAVIRPDTEHTIAAEIAVRPL